MMTDELESLVMADAIGALDEDDSGTLQRQIAALPPDQQRTIAKLYDVALLVAAAADPHDPPPQAKARLLSAIEAPGNYTVAAQQAWGDSGVAGISAKVLAIDRARGLVTMLLRGSAGAVYPSHRHSTPEECYVIRGSIRIGDLVLTPGDFHHADADSDHDEIHVVEDAEVLLVAGIDDYLHG